MQTALLSIVYHSGKGHTAQLAALLAKQMQTPQTVVQLMSVEEATTNFETLHGSDAIVFGCPTYFGNVSAAFKEFMEATGRFWYKQRWKNKLAAAFTLSSTTGGDKLNTLQSLMLFAAQHSMHWINLGVLPRFLNDEQTDGQNRLAGYIGLMAQCDNGAVVRPIQCGDALTAELFAQRIVETTLHFKQIKIINHDTIAN